MGASYIYVFAPSVFCLHRSGERDREINMGDNTQGAMVARILDWEPGNLDLSHLNFKNLQSLKWC